MKKMYLLLALLLNQGIAFPSDNFGTVETHLSGNVSPAEGKEIGIKVKKAFIAVNKHQSDGVRVNLLQPQTDGSD